MTNRVFRVKIVRSDGTRNDMDVIASDDVKARAVAIETNVKEYWGDAPKGKIPAVVYCEIHLVTEAVSG